MERQLLDDEDFRVLMGRHRDRLYRTCLKMTGGDEQGAEDLCQEALARAWERRASFEGRSAFSTWLIGFAKYQNLNDRRKRRELLSEDGVLTVTTPGYGALKELTAEEREELVLECSRACLDQLEQDVAYLRYSEEMPLDAITRELNLPGASGARGVLQRIKRKLGIEMRARLAELGHGTSFVRTQV